MTSTVRSLVGSADCGTQLGDSEGMSGETGSEVTGVVGVVVSTADETTVTEDAVDLEDADVIAEAVALAVNANVGNESSVGRADLKGEASLSRLLRHRLTLSSSAEPGLRLLAGETLVEVGVGG